MAKNDIRDRRVVDRVARSWVLGRRVGVVKIVGSGWWLTDTLSYCDLQMMVGL